jgi:hypothetical protein
MARYPSGENTHEERLRVFSNTNTPVRKLFVFISENIVCSHAAAIARARDF